MWEIEARRVFAVADLHLGFFLEKPMDIFGDSWFMHHDKLEKNWRSKVSEEDLVIIAGDISWALKMQEALPDLDFINSLPGKKLLFKGNHDLWWQSVSKLNGLGYNSLYFIQNGDFVRIPGNGYICGTRGWLLPGDDKYKVSVDEKICKRELGRLEKSLAGAVSHSSSLNIKPDIIGVLHYPPTNKYKEQSDFTRLFEKYSVKKVIYGHLHGNKGYEKGLIGNLNNIEYNLVSLDYLKFDVMKISDENK